MLPNVKVDSLALFDKYFDLAIRRLGLDAYSGLITALSGGPDSTALAILAQRYAERKSKRHVAIIVDHGLRPNSGAEAARVRNRMEKRNIKCEVKSIGVPPPNGGLQEWARSHRHTILTRSACSTDSIVLFGHHRDDQAETVAMRLLKGSGLSGLAGIPGKRWQHDVIFGRPLINWPRESLKKVCNLSNCNFELDPSNEQVIFERVRIRNMLSDLKKGEIIGKLPLPERQTAEVIGSSGLNRLQNAAAAIITLFDKAIEKKLASAFVSHPGGFATFVPSELGELSMVSWWRVLRMITMTIGGKKHGISETSALKCYDRISDGRAATLGGCHFSPLMKNRLIKRSENSSKLVYRVYREVGRTRLTKSIMGGESKIFSGCWRLKSLESGLVCALGDLPKFVSGLEKVPIGSNLPDTLLQLPYKARIAIPVISTLDGGLLYPHFEEGGRVNGSAPFVARHLGLVRPPKYALTDK